MYTDDYLLKYLGNPNDKAVHYMLKMWHVPKSITDYISCWPKRIYCHPLLADCLGRCLELVITRNLQSEIKTFDGCYNVRKIRGISNRWSVHSWGLAFDINASENKLGQEPKISKELVECFTDFFEWGGYFNRKDGMHFQIRRKFI